MDILRGFFFLQLPIYRARSHACFMPFFDTLKKHVLIIVPVIVFAAWIGFLLINSLGASRRVTFYDALHQVDVSGQYSSEVPLERYLLEPFVGFAFTLATEIQDSMLLLLVVYVVIRFVFALLEKVILRGNAKKEILVHYARKVGNFYWKYAFFAFIVVFLCIIAGISLDGFLFMHQEFMSYLQAGLISWLILLAAKIIQNMIIFFKKDARLRIKPRKWWLSLPRNKFRFWHHKTWDFIGREIRYGLTFLMIYAAISLNLMSTYLPPQVIKETTPLQPGEMLMDFHCHTRLSDGFLTPEDRVNWYIGQGLQGAAITDHENVNGGLEAAAYVASHHLNFTVIVGQEYTKYNPRIHLNVFGINQTIPTDELLGGNTSASALPPMNVSTMIHYVKTHGGYVVVNHYGYDNVPYSLEQLRLWSVDGFEIVNGGGVKDDRIRQFCLNNSLICLATSDEASSVSLTAFTRFKLANPLNRSIDAIFAALKNYSTTQCIAVKEQQNRIDWPRALNDFSPLRDFIVYLRSIDAWQSFSWMAWSCGFFALYLVALFWIKKHVNAQEQNAKIIEDPRKRSFMFAHRGITIGAVIAGIVIFLLLAQFLISSVLPSFA